MRDNVKTLVNEGKLEVILGGWCMNDEATPYYVDIIDQHTLGFEFIRQNFGECGRPKIGWQIDPFGHSREVASLFAQFGFDGMFVGRIDYQDKMYRKNTQSMEMVWKTSTGTDIFVGVLNNVYWPPKGFCWDYWCSDPELATRGTEKQHVSDYTRLLQNGIYFCEVLSDESAKENFQQCRNLPLEACNITESNGKFSVVVYNPLSRNRSYIVSLPVIDADYEIYDHRGDLVEYQIVPISKETRAIPERPKSSATKSIVFEALLPALGISTFLVQKKTKRKTETEEWLEEQIIELAEESVGGEPYHDVVETIENQYYTVTVDRKTGLIARLWNKHEDVAISLKQNFLYYIPHGGFNYNGESQTSGAYIFRPTSPAAQKANQGLPVSIYSYKGALVQEIRQVFCPWISQVIRLYNNRDHVELEWIVGPLPSGVGLEGKETITRYMTDLESKGRMYTDLNGRETLMRQRDARETWDFVQREQVSGNYYPITSRAAIRGENRGIQFTVLVDRSEGAASISDGDLEIMWSGLCYSLSESVNILTLETLLNPVVKTEHAALLLRLEHIFQKFEDEKLSNPVIVNLRNLFKPFRVIDAFELLLGANLEKEDVVRLNWKTKDSSGPRPEHVQYSTDTELSFEILPMQIRTFQINVEYW